MLRTVGISAVHHSDGCTFSSFATADPEDSDGPGSTIFKDLKRLLMQGNLFGGLFSSLTSFFSHFLSSVCFLSGSRGRGSYPCYVSKRLENCS